MKTNIFDRLSFLSLFLVVVLLPVFCLPFTNIPVEISKGLLLVLGLVACVIFWAMARFVDGKIVFPRSWLLWSGFGIVLVFFLSSLLSGSSSQVSLFGRMFDVGSFWFIFGSFLLMFFSSIVFRTPKHAKIVLFGTVLSSVFVLIFQSIHLFAPKYTSLGILADKTTNILGSWNALGLFAGFAGLMFLLVIEFFPISKIEKIVLQIFILLSILVIAAVNFPLVWILLGISSLIIFVYKISITLRRNENVEENSVANETQIDTGGEKKHFPIVSFVVLIISLLFFMSSGFFGNIIPNYLNAPNTEPNLSLGATMSIAKGVLVQHPLFGIGPNRFGEAWSMYKPVSINTTVVNNQEFWDSTFQSGSGLLPTFIATTGYIGILAWLVFFILLLIIGARSVFSNIKHGANWEMVAFFVLSLYLFVASFFYSVGTVIFLLALVFTGIFVGLSSRGVISMSFLNDHRKSFLSILILIVLVITSIAIAFKYIERFTSVAYFGKALNASTIVTAEDSISKALALYVNDLYLRTYAQIFLVKFNSIANKDSATLSDADKADLQASPAQVISGALSATTYDPTNYLNFQALGSAYQSLASFGVKDTDNKDLYGKAIDAYTKASALNPNNPGLKLSMAIVSIAEKQTKEAKDYANAALTLKPDYIDALVVLSQIAKSEGDSASALSYAQTALSLYPTDVNLIKYVDSLKNPAVAPAPAPIPKKP